MAELYETQAGDTWDAIAKFVYDDESKAGILMEYNTDCLDTFVFSSKVILYVPDLEEEEEEEDLPDWRYDDEEEEE